VTEAETTAQGFSRRNFLSATAILAAVGLTVESLAYAPTAFANGTWGGYSNGAIPLSALVQINYPGVIPYHYCDDALDHVYMAPGASDRLLGMLAAYHSATGGYLRVSEGYRTFAGQVWLKANDNGTTPGQSPHGWGQAVDFDSGLITDAQIAWLATNGPTYDFAPLKDDKGHYDYNGPITPLPSTTTSYLEDDLTDMLYYVTGSTTYTTNGVKTPAVAVVPDSVWYQERPGAPLFYVAASAGASAEYSAFLGARFSNANAGRCAVPANQLGALIELRGQSLQPAATLAPLRT
jgi:hypothetical protein